jgi:hypothetical protein
MGIKFGSRVPWIARKDTGARPLDSRDGYMPNGYPTFHAEDHVPVLIHPEIRS